MKAVCIGAGRLAHHLMPELQHAGCEIIQVYNRSNWPAVLLARKLHAPAHITSLHELDVSADLYFLTLSDDAVGEVATQIQSLHQINGTVIHCSGVLGIDILPFEKRGVFYPLQTFSEHHDVEWRQVPIIVTSDKAEVNELLKLLAAKISSAVFELNDREKTVIHLAAVFANNFTNHMLTLAEEICIANHLSFEILKPLIRMTVDKALETGPFLSQTGPAVRGDQSTIERHMKLLESHPEWLEVYRVVTRSIGKD